MTDPTFTLRNVNSYLIFCQLAIWNNVCTSPERNRIDIKINAIFNLVSTTFAVFKNMNLDDLTRIELDSTLEQFEAIFKGIQDLRYNYETKLEDIQVTSPKEIQYIIQIDDMFKEIIIIIVHHSLIQSEKIALEWDGINEET